MLQVHREDILVGSFLSTVHDDGRSIVIVSFHFALILLLRRIGVHSIKVCAPVSGPAVLNSECHQPV